MRCGIALTNRDDVLPHQSAVQGLPVPTTPGDFDRLVSWLAVARVPRVSQVSTMH